MQKLETSEWFQFPATVSEFIHCKHGGNFHTCRERQFHPCKAIRAITIVKNKDTTMKKEVQITLFEYEKPWYSYAVVASIFCM